MAAPSGVLKQEGTCVRKAMTAAGRMSAGGPQRGENGSAMRNRLQAVLQERPNAGSHQTLEPSEDQTSILRVTRSTTSLVNSVVPWWPPRSGVRTPAAVASSTLS
jgi:hypothetical protein